MAPASSWATMCARSSSSGSSSSHEALRRASLACGVSGASPEELRFSALPFRSTDCSRETRLPMSATPRPGGGTGMARLVKLGS